MITVYEFPLTERVRYLLKFEHVTKQLREAMQAYDPASALRALRGICDLVDISGYKDLCKEMRHQLTRQLRQLEDLEGRPDIENRQLERYLNRTRKLIEHLDKVKPRFLQLNDNHFIASSRRKLCVVAGVCSFDAPMLTAWSNSEELVRNYFDLWLSYLDRMDFVAGEILNITRECKHTQKILVENGYHAQSLNSTESRYQLLRVEIASPRIYPEVSLGRYGFTFHLFRLEGLHDRPVRVKQNLSVEITLCAF